jgi:DNA-3-methyladenine glycosylase II
MGLDHARALSELSDSCEVMADLIPRFEPPVLHPKNPKEYFEVLVSSIIGQQLSVKAADTIEARVRAGVGSVTPFALAKMDVPELRVFGLSQSKAAYIIGLAEAFRDGTLDPLELEAMDDEAVIEALTGLKGIGPWTAEMFLIFGMGHPNVWSPGDLGLKKAVWALFGADSDPVTISERWQPYRSYAALYLWEFSDAGISAQKAVV